MVSRPVNVLSLCSGAGGLDRGVRMALPTARTVCYVEIEAYAAEVLACRMEEGRLDSAPLWTDLRTFDGRPWSGAVDLVLGGYPCQPFSVAGARRGADDPRHLWPHIARILRELDRPCAFFENVSGHVSLGLREVRSELEDMGYCVEAESVRAEEVGAPHRRERLFILAYADQGRSGFGLADSNSSRVGDADQLRRRSGASGTRTSDAGGGGSILAYTNRVGEQQPHDTTCTVTREDARQNPRRRGDAVGDADDARLEGRGMRGSERADEWSTWPPGPADDAQWRQWNGPQPAIRRDADGLASRMVSRVDELRLCGGGVVPQQAAYAFNLLRERVRQ